VEVEEEEELDREWSRSKGGGAQSPTAMEKMTETPVV
jgi:hypothetical protein